MLYGIPVYRQLIIFGVLELSRELFCQNCLEVVFPSWEYLVLTTLQTKLLYNPIPHSKSKIGFKHTYKYNKIKSLGMCIK